MIPVLTAQQFRDIDNRTCVHESVSETELMERAAMGCVAEIVRIIPEGSRIAVICGNGNNSGDGIAIGRMLREKGHACSIYRSDGQTSPGCRAQLEKISGVHSITGFQAADYDVIIDALLGTGTSRELSGDLLAVVSQVNAVRALRISIDIPSGLSPDVVLKGMAVNADMTLVIGAYKLTQFLPETAGCYGTVTLIPLYSEELLAKYEDVQVLDVEVVSSLVRPRKKFSHKGTYGHALLVAGSKGKVGAAILSASACLRSGVGLLTVESPEACLLPLQIAAPEAMVRVNGSDLLSDTVDTSGFSAVGVGPGLTTAREVVNAIEELFDTALPKVIDADALNSWSENRHWKLRNAVLTPHPKEFSRLAGKEFVDSVERFGCARDFARANQCVLVLKDAVTMIFSPEGIVAANSTGNPGMATGGMGDTLTGIVLGLLAQGYSCWDAARIAVFHHGLAGDKVAAERGEAALIARDVIGMLKIEERT